MEQTTNLKPLVIKTNLGNSFFNYQDIIRFEANGHYTVVFLSEGKKIQCTLSISTLNDELPKSKFFRCHRCHIVNLSHISNYNSKTSILTVAENEIPISRSYQQEFMELFASGQNIQARR
jgi:two-component system LytT family response regulator